MSSGAPPAAIAILRLSGSLAFAAAERLAGRLPAPRRAAVRALRDPHDGTLLDRCLVLAFPAPHSATGEDIVELHVHGGRAVVRAVEVALSTMPGLRRAEPGEFTRRALVSGRIDLTEAEGLGDLLMAETEAQRRAAMDSAEGGVSRLVAGWGRRLLEISAGVEALLDFSDEDDVAAGAPSLSAVREEMHGLAREIEAALETPPVERLRDGIRVVLAGPPNSGKSTLFNALVAREAAIVSPVAGTTRDLIEAPVVRAGIAYLLVDTAGLAESTDDPVERIGIRRAGDAIERADIVLWLGAPSEAPGERAIIVHARADLPGRSVMPAHADLALAAARGGGIAELWVRIDDKAATLLAGSDGLLMNQRQRTLVAGAGCRIEEAARAEDPLIVAEELRRARSNLDRITGRAGVEEMLDELFARFCVGK